MYSIHHHHSHHEHSGAEYNEKEDLEWRLSVVGSSSLAFQLLNSP
jgi:hypothetical protein